MRHCNVLSVDSRERKPEFVYHGNTKQDNFPFKTCNQKLIGEEEAGGDRGKRTLAPIIRVSNFSFSIIYMFYNCILSFPYVGNSFVVLEVTSSYVNRRYR